MPASVGRNLKRLRGRHAIWVRVPAGAALIGGILSFLPLLGIWMLPLGLALLAQDIPVIRRPMAHLLDFTNRNVEKWKDKKRAGS
jgi:hypothetical protein